MCIRQLGSVEVTYSAPVRFGICGFRFAHSGGNHREFCGERSAETAAFFAIGHFDKLQLPHMPEQFAWLLLQMQFAQRVTGVMVSHAMGEAGAHVGDFGDLHQKLGKFEDALPKAGGFFDKRRARKQFWIEMRTIVVHEPDGQTTASASRKILTNRSASGRASCQ